MNWEYRTLAANPDAMGFDKTKEVLDSFGAKGWELVSVVAAGANYRDFFFKRMLPSSTTPERTERDKP